MLNFYFSTSLWNFDLLWKNCGTMEKKLWYTTENFGTTIYEGKNHDYENFIYNGKNYVIDQNNFSF